MKVLLTKSLPVSELDRIRSWGWEYETIETLEITPVEVKEIPEAEVWIISSRNSFAAVKKFIDRAPGAIYCVGKWINLELRKIGINSMIFSFENMAQLASNLREKNFQRILYFCGESHRPELEEGLKNSTTKIFNMITHKSKMNYPVIKNDFDAIFVFSPRSVESLLKCNQFNEKTIFACIGQTTASFLHRSGITNVFVASFPETRILIEEFHTRILNLKS